MVVGEFARLGGETQVRDGRDLEVGDLKALRPVVFILVLEFEAQELVLEVG